MAEVLVAGLVILLLLVASARLVSTSMARGQQTAQRQRVEAEVASDMDRLYQQDQALKTIVDADQTHRACTNPASSLKESLDAVLPAAGGSSRLWSRQTSITAAGLIQVAYILRLPGSRGSETRVVELAPSIQATCLERAMGLS